MTNSKLIHSRLARARILLALLACMLGLFACTIGGRVGSGGVLQQDWDKRRGPVVPHDSFPRDCSMCHLGAAWSDIRADFVFDHEKETGTPLRGAHARAECLRCHNDRGPVERFAAEGCTGCHEDIHRGKQGSQCTNCHSETNWGVSDAIAMHSKTRFPLFGVHASTECWRCHEGAQVGNFDRAPIECASCHKQALASATNPDHMAQGWVSNCDHCHAPISWGEGDFNHSWFPLVGHHAPPQRQCVDCHTNDVWHGLHNQCVDCHLTAYEGSVDPPHVAAAIPQGCADCHTPQGWRGAPYDHSFWPLVGNHTVGPRSCTDCHQAGVFQGTATTCVGCHMAQYNATTTPNHAASGYPTSCENCHDTVDFHAAVFNHSTWPLVGTHRDTICTACHTSSDYSSAPTVCIGCHQADFQGALNPNHVQAGFPSTCEQCHTTVHFTPSTFNHTSLFPLVNAHAMPPRTCTDCHSNGNFLTTPTTCIGCHGASATINPVYNPSSNMAHQQLGPNGTTCTNCHNDTTWLTTTFDHSAFTLTGAHLYPTQCADCHVGSNYGNAPTTCVGCHLANYNSTTNPPHQQSNFATTCQDCHNTTGWAGANFTHAMWPLTGLHTVPPNACTNCHLNGVYNNAPTACVGCHLSNYNNTTNPPHLSNGFPQTCQTCHTTHGWAGADFNHSWWPLTGQHMVPPALCSQCHKGGNYTTNPPTTCVGCHLTDYNNTANPPHAIDGFPQTCETCHTTNGWAGSNFNHSWWPLTGSHNVPPRVCLDCHARGNYTTNPPTTCVGCHLADYNGANSPSHTANNFAQTGQDCHNTNAWQPANFNHTPYFPLTGAHTVPPLACTQCHLAGNYRMNLPQTCSGCHGIGATVNPVYVLDNPTHQGLGTHPTECTNCHGNTTWLPSTFSHTSYPLTGLHIGVSCSQCHTGGSYQGAPTNCVGCHQTDYNGTTNPPHASSNFPTTCETCHTTAGWTGATFNHSWWPLTGLHTVPPRVCTDCHAGGNYSTNPPTACSGCHMADYNGTTNPPHASSNFPTTCQTCHTTAGWTGATFNHSWWPLTGLHTVPPRVCTDCHIGGNYSTNPPTNCAGCHIALYNATTSPPHLANNFPTTCQNCHTTAGWQPATFNHTSYYPLTGAHVSPPLACTACHLAGNYTTTLPTTCVGCHGSGATVNPVYSTSGNPTHGQTGSNPPVCTNCHNNTTWVPSSFDHTSYPLTGTHVTTACTACHTGTSYNNAPTTCWGCHQADFNGTTNPPHVSSNFPHTCDTCHTTAGWTGSNFNHSWWPLTGLHTVPPRTCTQCHIGGNYSTNPPTACSGCHMADYNGTTNPNHATSQFPTTCQTCHTTSGWAGSDFNHSQWPLTGAHTVPPRTCIECHTGGNYTNTLPTACYGCHQANFDGTTSPPHLANNFSHTCTTCHTTTAWQPATFNHTTYYALTGAHLSPPLACTACHVGGNYTNTLPITCVGCHGISATIDPQYNSSSNITHQQLGTNPPVCTMCHNNTTWIPSTFTHTTWPLTGLHLPPHTTACTQCHTRTNYNSAPTACSGCHMADYNGTTNPPHASSSFPTTCETCHTTAGWTGATFNHSWWPLVGAHQVPPRVCTDCHTGGNYSTNPPTACSGCHMANYNGTTNPPHVSNNFPQTCQTCHNTVAWQPATFTHTNVGFNLTGAHVSPPLACGNCHVNGNYAGTLPTTCVGCHQSDYNGTTNPSHSANGIPTTCTNCHTTNAGWAPVTMNHTGVTGACSNCHTPDYNSTTSPAHLAMGYPMTCSGSGAMSCHTSTTSWTPMGFNPNTTHDSEFPLSHHTGSGNSTNCSQCHTTPQTFTAFSCISGGCHGQSGTNSHHSNVNNYVYASPNCYACHPNGQSLTGGIERTRRAPVAVRPPHIRPNRRAPPERIPGTTAPPPQFPSAHRP